MKDSNVTHSISIGDTWCKKGSDDECVIKDIKIACGGNALIFFIENGETKFIEFAEKFCDIYEFKHK